MKNEPYIMRDPTAELAPAERQRLAPLPSLEGKTVGILSISKERSDEFLDHVSDLLDARGVKNFRIGKPTNAKTAPVEILQRTASQASVVVMALAD